MFDRPDSFPAERMNFNFPAPTIENGELTFINSPSAQQFKVLAFANDTDTNVANAKVATVAGNIPFGHPTTAFARGNVTVDLSQLTFTPALNASSTYHLRVQAVSMINPVPVVGLTDVFWGQDSPLTPPVAFTQTQVAAPVPAFTSGGAATAARTVTWPAVTGATSYTMYLYARPHNAARFPNPGETLDEQIAAGLVVRVARATNVAADTTHDIRFMNFEALGGNTWVINPTPLPFPQGALQTHDANGPTATTPGNLMPGAYWVRVQAVASNTINNSELSEWWVPPTPSEGVPPQGQLQGREHPLIVGMGPTQARSFMEARNPGAPNQGFRNIDVRPDSDNPLADERNNEGIIRFSERHVNIQNVNWNTGVTAGLFGGDDVRTEFDNPNEPLLFY